MAEAVGQLDDAFRDRASATVGVTVVFTLSAGSLQDVDPVVEGPADDAALVPRVDEHTTHRLIVRISSLPIHHDAALACGPHSTLDHGGFGGVIGNHRN